MESVLVVGLGSVGRPTAEHFAARGFPTYGCDVDPGALERAPRGLAGVSASLADLPLADAYIVPVNTGLQGELPDIENVFRACAAIARRGVPRLVSIESTVPVGTCERLHAEVFHLRGNLVHVPHRWWAVDPVNHGIAQPRVVGSIKAEGIALALDLYGRAGIPLVPVRDIRLAELSKVAENTDRYLKIAYAEFLRMVSEELGLDFEELRRAMNSKWNVEVLEARDGIGGSCLPKDILYLRAAAPHLSPMLDAARVMDQLYRGRVAKGGRRPH